MQNAVWLRWRGQEPALYFVKHLSVDEPRALQENRKHLVLMVFPMKMETILFLSKIMLRINVIKHLKKSLSFINI